ncbi:MAG: hypothetical protein QXH37_09535 [Candidatus Bathyarchaeia archaeon]
MKIAKLASKPRRIACQLKEMLFKLKAIAKSCPKMRFNNISNDNIMVVPKVDTRKRYRKEGGFWYFSENLGSALNANKKKTR